MGGRTAPLRSRLSRRASTHHPSCKLSRDREGAVRSRCFAGSASPAPILHTFLRSRLSRRVSIPDAALRLSPYFLHYGFMPAVVYILFGAGLTIAASIAA